MHLHGDKKRKWYEAYFFLYVRIVCNILYIYIISRRPARSTNEHGRIETYSCLWSMISYYVISLHRCVRALL